MQTTTWSSGLVVGRCLGYGALSGAVCAVGTLFLLFAVDGGIDSVGMAFAASVIYAPMALVVGCMAGLVDGVVVGTVLVTLGRSTQQHLGGARVMAGAVAAVPPLLLLWSDLDLALTLGIVAACALGAAFWTRRILGMMGA